MEHTSGSELVAENTFSGNGVSNPLCQQFYQKMQIIVLQQFFEIVGKVRVEVISAVEGTQ